MSAQRYPVNVRLIGVILKTKSKVFMTSVLWSDDSNIIIYRSFQDFRKLHKQLKKRFPTERSNGKKERMIPKFRVQAPKKGPSKSMVRLKFLKKYFDQLLKCDPNVTQSTEIAQFFQPTAHDLQPEFAKDSIMIMTSEDINRDQPSSGDVIQPFVTETYQCVAAYETKDTKNQPFKVSADETVDVLIKDKGGWWLVENSNKCKAWFPAPYLEKCEEEDNEEDSGNETIEEGMLYCAVKNFNSTKADEASLSIGDVVEVQQKSNNGWWLIRYKGKVGYAPSMYLKPYSNPKMRLVTMQKEMWNSITNLSQVQIPGSSLATLLASSDDHLNRSYGNLLSPEYHRPSDLHALRQKPQSVELLAKPLPHPHSAQPTIREESPPRGEQGAGRSAGQQRERQ